MELPAEWNEAVRWIAEKFGTTHMFVLPAFRESQLDHFIPAGSNRDALLKTLEQQGAIGPRRTGLYALPLPDTPQSANRVQLPISTELRDIYPPILDLAEAMPDVTIRMLCEFAGCSRTPIQRVLKGLSVTKVKRGREAWYVYGQVRPHLPPRYAWPATSAAFESAGQR